MPSSCLNWITGVSHWAQMRLLTCLFDLVVRPDSSEPFQGIDEGPEGLKLISDIIREKMGIDISVLMGANIASEVAAEKFCETTIGEATEGLGSVGCLACTIPVCSQPPPSSSLFWCSGPHMCYTHALPMNTGL